MVKCVYDVQERCRSVGGDAAGNVTEMIGKLTQTPRVVSSMVPAGKVTDSVLTEAAALQPGDILIDGGNSPYSESVRQLECLFSISCNR